MTYELRAPEEDEFVAFMRPAWRGFGVPAPTDEQIEDERFNWECDRSIGAVDGDEWVGTAFAYSFDLTVPGGASTPVAGVTMVGVAGTHRRQGVLTALMSRQLDDVADRGELLAVLTASETNIYGRFGYGWGASTATVTVDTRSGGFRTPPATRGRLRVLTTAEAAEPLFEAYESGRRRRAGTVSRDLKYWQYKMRDRDRWREGGSALFVVVHEDDDGRPDGLALYRVEVSWPDSIPDSTIRVLDLYGADDEVEAILWRFLLDIDLARHVRVDNRPVDDPIRWRLVEPRQLRTKEVVDHLWVRVLDVPGALALRTYAAAGSLVLRVDDTFRPASGGTFRLDVAADGTATATPTADAPDLVLGAEEIGSIYLGGVAPSALAGAGRITESVPGAIARADAIFVTPRAPFNGTMF